MVNHAHSLPEQEQANNFHEWQQEPVHVQYQQQEALQQQHLEHTVESAAKRQSEDIVQQPPAPMPQSYAEAPRYGTDSYLPQDPRQWSLHNPYPPVLNVHQEPHLHPAYPHWLQSSYQNVPQPNSYYGNPYDGQTIYNTQYPAVQVPPQASAHATSAVSGKLSSYK